MAGVDGSSAAGVAFPTELYNQITLELAGIHAGADVLAQLAAQGDVESLERHTLATMLLELEERIGKLRTLVVNHGALVGGGK